MLYIRAIGLIFYVAALPCVRAYRAIFLYFSVVGNLHHHHRVIRVDLALLFSVWCQPGYRDDGGVGGGRVDSVVLAVRHIVVSPSRVESCFRSRPLVADDVDNLYHMVRLLKLLNQRLDEI